MTFRSKKALNLSNVGEAFFQAVPSSFWANPGYPIAARISDGQILYELMLLNGRPMGMG